MDATHVRQDWGQRWGDHEHHELGWFQAEPEPSLELVTRRTPSGGSVLDVGGGASHLVDRLLGRGFHPTVLDIAAPALGSARARLGGRADDVTWVQGDVTEIRLEPTFDVATLRHHLVVGGHAIIGTFSPEGPDSCSGLPVRRHSADDVEQLLGEDLHPVESRSVVHTTPSGGEQAFTFTVLRRQA